VGRTGRAGNAGTAITLVTPEEYRKLFRFKRAAGAGFKRAKVPEVDEVLAVKRDRLRGKILARAEALAEDAASAALFSDESSTAALPAKGAGKKIAAAASGPRATAKLWRELADDILSAVEPGEALAAALFEAFGSEIDPARYKRIEEGSVDAAATARLFVGVGKRDRATPKSLAALVKRISGLPDRLIGGIEIYENFSFLTVPFEAAEKVISESRRSGGLPPVRLATPKGGTGESAAAERGAHRRPPRPSFAKGPYGKPAYGTATRPGAPAAPAAKKRKKPE